MTAQLVVNPDVILAIGCFVGCYLRTTVPYIRKVHALKLVGNGVKFKRRYIATLLVNVTVAVTTANRVVVLLGLYGAHPVWLFGLGVVCGWAGQDLTNEVVKFLELLKAKRAGEKHGPEVRTN